VRARKLTTIVLPRVLAIVAALAVWHLFATGAGAASGLPTPWMTVVTAADIVTTAAYWEAIGNTLFSALIAFVLSVLVGVPIGLINGSFRRVELSTNFVVDFMRTVPSIAILPVVLLALGSTRTMVVALVMFGAVWPLLIQSTYAAKEISPQLAQVAMAFRMNRASRIRHIYIPSAMPFITTGLRIAATLSLLLTIAAEFFGGAPGIGQALLGTLNIYDPEKMFVYVFTAAFLGVGFNALLVYGQSRMLWWHPSQREKARR
jgi:ABC-type nitrate/sulfonate/bicarbonate transport system permease component